VVVVAVERVAAGVVAPSRPPRVEEVVVAVAGLEPPKLKPPVVAAAVVVVAAGVAEPKLKPLEAAVVAAVVAAPSSEELPNVFPALKLMAAG